MITAALARPRWIPVAAALVVMPIVQSADAQNIEDDNVWLVDGDDGSDMNSGQEDWEDAFETIDKAFSVAESGDVIWVASTTVPYKPDTTAGFELLDGVGLHGGFAGTETNRVNADPYFNPTILSGEDIDGQGARATHVVTATNLKNINSRLDGFIIKGGRTVTSETSDQSDSGGGLLYLTTTAPANYLTVTRCLFEDNEAVYGGAVAVIRTDDTPSAFTGLMFTNCEFTGNTAGNGGGVMLRGVDVTFTNCLFASNTADTRGGGLYLAQTCPLWDSCDPEPCGLFQTTFARVQSCTLTDNQADDAGGAVYITYQMGMDTKSSIYWGNTRDNNGTPVPDQFAGDGTCSGPNATYCCVQGGLSGTGNISSDPEFAGPAATPPNYRLDSSSPCVDEGVFDGNFPSDVLDFDHDGSTTGVGGELAPDLDRFNRIIKCAIDMGCYERLCDCLADMVDDITFLPPPDGEVTGADLAFLLGEWGPNPGSDADIVTSATFQPPPDGEVDGADLAYLLGSWGVCPERDCECEEGLGGGGGSSAYGGTEIGDLLDELLEEDDEEAAAELAAELLELLTE